ncbi:hypothetical protein NDU88_001835 [Pleurodeles waltl]|uniref:Uncharacterized protein n=1 Tax=Pleurodeles waltl TaxID=8319 RepID=A0AAV7WQJ6_PLEWA|nr:hypothetical protein NDU88_001835 [Pleurodeles waltl]
MQPQLSSPPVYVLTAAPLRICAYCSPPNLCAPMLHHSGSPSGTVVELTEHRVPLGTPALRHRVLLGTPAPGTVAELTEHSVPLGTPALRQSTVYPWALQPSGTVVELTEHRVPLGTPALRHRVLLGTPAPGTVVEITAHRVPLGTPVLRHRVLLCTPAPGTVAEITEHRVPLGTPALRHRVLLCTPALRHRGGAHRAPCTPGHSCSQAQRGRSPEHRVLGPRGDLVGRGRARGQNALNRPQPPTLSSAEGAQAEQEPQVTDGMFPGRPEVCEHRQEKQTTSKFTVRREYSYCEAVYEPCLTTHLHRGGYRFRTAATGPLKNESFLQMQLFLRETLQSATAKPGNLNHTAYPRSPRTTTTVRAAREPQSPRVVRGPQPQPAWPRNRSPWRGPNP